jgi:hypothetical protein
METGRLEKGMKMNVWIASQARNDGGYGRNDGKDKR